MTKHTMVTVSCVTRQSGMGTVYELYNKTLGNNYARAKYTLYVFIQYYRQPIHLHQYPHKVLYHGRYVSFLNYSKVKFLVQILKT